MRFQDQEAEAQLASAKPSWRHAVVSGVDASEVPEWNFQSALVETKKSAAWAAPRSEAVASNRKISTNTPFDPAAGQAG